MLSITRRQALKAVGHMAVYASAIGDLTKIAMASAPEALAGDDLDLHLLRRVSFGPTAAELSKVRELGRSAYIDQLLSTRDSGVHAWAVALFPRILEPVQLTYLTTGTGFLTAYHVTDLQNAKIYRAAMSRAQLFEVMVDFWNDHFNTYVRQALVPLTLDFDRDVIRANAMGTFETLLNAVFHSACMQRYLDNSLSTIGAINENYARELMELHTLGQGSGYTEDDVQALAILLSGWQVGQSAVPYAAVSFNASLHDPSAVTFLGHNIAAGATQERAYTALRILVEHPATAQFIARKLCQRFISETPSASAVSIGQTAFTNSGGHIPTVLRALLNSEAFNDSIGSKYKRPIDVVAGTMRAAALNGFDTALGYNPIYPTANPAYQALLNAGAEPFAWVSPDGPPDRRAYWENTNTLLALQQFFVKVSESTAYGRLLTRPGTLLGTGGVLDSLSVASGVARARTPRQAVDNLVQNLLLRSLPAEAMDVLYALQAQGAPLDQQQDAATLSRGAAGVMMAVLSSPWFMVR